MVQARTSNLPGRFITMNSVSKSMVDNFKMGLPLDDVLTYEQRYKAMTVEGLTEVVNQYIHPEKLIWVIHGDLSKIQAGISALNLGPVTVIETK